MKLVMYENQPMPDVNSPAAEAADQANQDAQAAEVIPVEPTPSA
jgi:hypothetical protein